jgi:hypothetical protein
VRERPVGTSRVFRFHESPLLRSDARSMVMEIEVKDGSIAIVDAEDWDFLKGFRWYRITNPKPKGAMCFIDDKSYCMHRLVMGLERQDRILVRHRNSNYLDNRKENLRFITKSEAAGSIPGHSKTGFKGVHFDRRRGLYWASVFRNGEFYWLGNFGSAKQAAWAYDRAAESLFGEFAVTNGVAA